MLLAVRCFTCNKVVGDLWSEYIDHLRNGLSEREALDQIGLKRICCRRIILSHVDIIKDIIRYQ